MSLTTLMSVSELVLQDSVPEYCRSILCQALACSFEQRLWGFGANAQSKPKGDNNEMKTFMKSYFQFQLKSALYTGSLAPVDFSSAVFTCMHFQKIAKNVRLMRFSLHRWRNSFTHAFLVTNDLSAADLVHAYFCQT